MKTKIRPLPLAVCIAIPLAAGGISAWLTRDAMAAFEAVTKPPLAPPGWLFPAVWTVLFILMGIASYIVLTGGEEPREINRALWLYGIQLAFNFMWSIIFFNMKLYLFAFMWLIALLALIIVTAWRFFRILKAAGYLLLPYIIWVMFAGYLNLGIYLLN